MPTAWKGEEREQRSGPPALLKISLLYIFALLHENSIARLLLLTGVASGTSEPLLLQIVIALTISGLLLLLIVIAIG
jgi:hypothetical protein